MNIDNTNHEALEEFNNNEFGEKPASSINGSSVDVAYTSSNTGQRMGGPSDGINLELPNRLDRVERFGNFKCLF